MQRLNDPRIAAAIKILEAKWNEVVRINWLAEEVGLGTSRFEHLFKDQVGVPVREFLTRQRLFHAARLLLGTHLTIQEIASLVGINDRCNFNHVFQKRFGVGPRAFRRHYPHLGGAAHVSTVVQSFEP